MANQITKDGSNDPIVGICQTINNFLNNPRSVNLTPNAMTALCNMILAVCEERGIKPSTLKSRLQLTDPFDAIMNVFKVDNDVTFIPVVVESIIRLTTDNQVNDFDAEPPNPDTQEDEPTSELQIGDGITVSEHEGYAFFQTHASSHKDIALRLSNARFPIRYFRQMVEIELNTDDYETRLPSDSGKDAFLFGKPGTGKTTDAIFALYRAIRDQHKTGLYLTCKEITDVAENKASLKFDKEMRASVAILYERLMIQMERIDILVLDEICSVNPHTIEALEHALEKRFKAGKQTIFVSNHSFDKATSLQGKTIDKVIGLRLASRLKLASPFDYGDIDLRDSKNTRNNTEETFKMPGLILAHPEIPHIPTFAARNFIFKAISTQERSALTKVKDNGDIQEVSRNGTDYTTNVWSEGDSLQVTGPVCCDNDAKVLIACLQILAEFHAENGRGLSIRTTVTDICKRLKISTAGSSISSIKRSLVRLSMMSILYKQGKKGLMFSGTFITMGSQNWNTKDSFIEITFSKYIVPFYLAGSFSLLKGYSVDVSGIEFLIKIFLETHKDKTASISKERFLKMLGKENLEKKKADKYVENSKKRLKNSSVKATTKNGMMMLAL